MYKKKEQSLHRDEIPLVVVVLVLLLLRILLLHKSNDNAALAKRVRSGRRCGRIPPLLLLLRKDALEKVDSGGRVREREEISSGAGQTRRRVELGIRLWTRSAARAGVFRRQSRTETVIFFFEGKPSNASKLTLDPVASRKRIRARLPPRA